VAHEAEIVFLRQQLLVAARSAPAQLKLRTADRLVFVLLYRLFPALRQMAIMGRYINVLRSSRRAASKKVSKVEAARIVLAGRWKSGAPQHLERLRSEATVSTDSVARVAHIGRFLASGPTGPNLSERRFRALWDRAGGTAISHDAQGIIP
jgi:hypothetical protein